jgi:ATP-dependent DNA helicase RecQ
MDAKQIIALFNERKLLHNINFEPKYEQMLIAEHLLNGYNTLGFLPTGFGKTLCFLMKDMLSDKKTITLIISPLLSLMDNQIETLSKWGFSCAKIAHDTSIDICDRIANGDFSFVFASPESVLKQNWRKRFLNDVWQKRLCCLIFDEAHCLSEWGEDFRPDYAEMAQLRSLFKVPILAVTATCTNKVKEGIMSVLQLDPDDTKVVWKSPNRENIMIVCRKRSSGDIETEFDWLIEHLKLYGRKSKKILIYCRSIDTVSELFLSLKASLQQFAYADSIQDSSHLLLEMFHKCTDESSKTRILNLFTKPDSSIRCIIATVALGMGIDIRDVDLVVHYGCPKSVVSYWQEAGRCARDGRQGMSYILYDNFTASLKTTDVTMANIVRNSEKECIRQNVMNVFEVLEKKVIKNKLCGGCNDKKCACESCKCCSFCCSKCPCYGNVPLINSFMHIEDE